MNEQFGVLTAGFVDITTWFSVVLVHVHVQLIYMCVCKMPTITLAHCWFKKGIMYMYNLIRNGVDCDRKCRVYECNITDY